MTFLILKQKRIKNTTKPLLIQDSHICFLAYKDVNIWKKNLLH